MNLFMKHFLLEGEGGGSGGGAGGGAGAAGAGASGGGSPAGAAAGAGAAGAPPAGGSGTSPSGGTGGGAAAGGQASDWTSSLNDDLKGFVQNKGFKDPSMALDSYRNLEKLMGVPQDRLLKLPEKSDDPAWGDIYSRLGRPSDPKDYALPPPPEGVKADPAFDAWARSQFHALGLTKAQGEKLVSAYNELNGGNLKTAMEAYNAKMAADISDLKAEWGQAFEKNKALNMGVAQKFGIDETMYGKLENAIGVKATAQLLNRIGTGLGEDQFISGGTNNPGFNGLMTPSQAENQINTLMKDSHFMSKYIAGDADAKERMTRLHQMAAPGDRAFGGG